MSEMLAGTAGVPLHSLSNGETGAAQEWVHPYINAQDSNPAIMRIVDGDWSDYDKCDQYRVRPGHTLTPESLSLTYSAAAAESAELLAELAKEYDRPDLVLQVGMPSPLDMAIFTLGMEEGLAYLEVFAEATVAQIHQVHTVLGSDAVVQLETPAAFGFTQAGDQYLPPAVHCAKLAADLADLAAQAPAGTRFGLHFCLGDMNNKTRFGSPLLSGEPVVRLSRAVVEAWPAGRPLEYIHFPVAGGDQPPLTDPEIFSSLAGLADVVPAGTRIIAGIAHEAASLDEQQVTLRMAEDGVGRSLDVATACGMARGRTPAVAHLLMRRMVDLARMGEG
jgi:hypothetical protein